MDKVYQHGILNISANSAEDSTDGIFNTRDQQDIGAIQFSSPSLKASWKLAPNWARSFTWMYEVPTLKRAWVYRERQLSRRILHFNHEELVWECCGAEGSAFASEMFPNGAPFRHIFNYESKYQNGRIQKELQTEDPEIYALWNDICEVFSFKGITEPTDMPIILSSLAKEFAELLPKDQFIAGFWSSRLPQCLAWRAVDSKREATGDSIAPSWSWMSTGSHVELLNTWKWELKQPLLHILNINLKPEHNDPYGLLRYGNLHVQGFLRQISFTITEEEGLKLEVLENDKYRNIGPAWDNYLGRVCDVKFDEGPSKRNIDCYCIPVIINRRDVSDYRLEMTFLLLRKCSEAENATFMRIGWMKLGTLYSLKMRYTVSGEDTDLEQDLWQLFSKVIQAHMHSLTELGKDEELQSHGENPQSVGRGSFSASKSVQPHSSSGTTEDKKDVSYRKLAVEREMKLQLLREVANRTTRSEDISATLYGYDYDPIPNVQFLVRLEPQTLILV